MIEIQICSSKTTAPLVTDWQDDIDKCPGQVFSEDSQHKRHVSTSLFHELILIGTVADVEAEVIRPDHNRYDFPMILDVNPLV